jgi:hypothetical protein
VVTIRSVSSSRRWNHVALDIAMLLKLLAPLLRPFLLMEALCGARLPKHITLPTSIYIEEVWRRCRLGERTAAEKHL